MAAASKIENTKIMKIRLTGCLKFVLAIFVCMMVWNFWAHAQGTNTLEAPTAPPQVADSAAQPNVWLTFGLDRVSFLQHRPFANIPMWQFIASLVYIFLAFYVSKLLDFVIRERVQKWTAKTKTKLDDLLVALVQGPVKIITFVILLHIGMQVYSWPEGLAKFLSAALNIIIACSITYVLLKSVDALINLWRERTTTPDNEDFSRQLLPLISKTLKVFVVVIAVLVTSQNLGLNVTGLIASLSIGGLAIGLAAQDTLANLFGAVAVLVDKPCKVGDRIKLDAVDGVVESIGFRSTRIRNLDGHLVTVPNKTMGNAVITNISRRPNIKTVSNIGLTYDTTPAMVQRAVQILEEIYRSNPKTSDLVILFDKFEGSSLNINVTHLWGDTDYKAYAVGLQQFNLAIKERFDKEGINFAFPSTTVYLKQDSLPPLADARLATPVTEHGNGGAAKP